jgi:integrase
MLTEKRVRDTRRPGRYRDRGGPVAGLLLQVSPGGAKSYVLRYERHGREHMLGLGSAATFTLAEARQRARAARQLLADGIDPLGAKRDALAAARLAEQRKLSFKQAAERYFDQNESKWRSASHREQFINSLRAYAFPVLGTTDVAAIQTADVLRVLDPLWKTKTTTADRVRSRIESVLDWAVVRDYRPPGTNPAAWKNHLDQVLPAPRKVAPVAHFAAMPYGGLPGFMARLRAHQGSTARAVEFAILTAARKGEVIGATWPEIDFEQAIWTVSAARMKAAREHRVPLSDAAIDLLRKLPRETNNPHLFIGGRAGAALSARALSLFMRRLGLKGTATVHGFRSSFRDWAGETTAFAHDICEAALAHARGDATVRAYARGDLFDKRRKLMAAWAEYCASPARASGDVVKLRG